MTTSGIPSGAPRPRRGEAEQDPGRPAGAAGRSDRRRAGRGRRRDHARRRTPRGGLDRQPDQRQVVCPASDVDSTSVVGLLPGADQGTVSADGTPLDIPDAGTTTVTGART